MAAITVPVSVAPIRELAASGETSKTTIRFLLEAGLAMARLNVASHELEDVMDEVSRQLGVEARFNATPTSLFVGIGDGSDQHTHMLVVDRRSPNLARLSALHGLLRRVSVGQIGVEDALEELREIHARTRRGRLSWQVLMFIGVAGSSLVLSGASWADIAASSAVGGLVAVFIYFAAGSKRLSPMIEFCACLLAGASSSLLGHLFPPLNVFAVTLGAVLMLLPGMSLTTAVGEVAANALVSGSARLIGAVTVLISMTFGVALGLKLGPSRVSLVTASPDLLLESAALLIGGVCIVASFGARARHVPAGVVAGLIAYATSKHVGLWWSPDVGPVAGAFAVGLFSNVYARLTGQPASVALLPGVILLVPGSVGFRAIHALLDHNTMAGVEHLVAMVAVAMGIVTGLLMANMMCPARKLQSKRTNPGLESQ
ncbi:MAG: threonine/serine exporter ThrE family protein [Phycisphaerales bacterium JB043]